MGMFTKISESAFNELQTNAGVILKSFNPENPAAPADEDIVCATTGGITVSCVPSYEDMGADVDNCPNNTMELKKLTGWDCKISFTALSITAETLKLALGAADIAGGKVAPRAHLKNTDFSDIWWAGDLGENGVAAACLKNALSTGGVSIKTTKDGKGNLSVELTGHVSIKDIDTVPMEFYVKEDVAA